MQKIHFKKIVTLFSLCMAFVFVTGFSPKEIQIRPINDLTSLLINHYDGYSMQVPSSSKISLNDSHIMTQVDFGDTNVKVFVEDLKTSYASYLNYSLKGIRQTSSEHIVTYDGKTGLGNLTAHEISFYRRSLPRVKSDKKNYSIFFCKLGEKKALTFMVKSSIPINKSMIKPMLASIKFDQSKIQNVPKKVPASYNYEASSLQGFHQLSQQTQDLYSRYFLGEGRSWGIYMDGFWNHSKVGTLEREIGYDFKFMLLYHHMDSSNEYLSKAIDYCKRNDKYLEFTLQCELKNDRNEIYNILSGSYDSFINEMAQIISTKQYPTIFRFANEMNGDWCSYSAYNTGLDADIYKLAYDYIYDIFEKNGATQYLLYVFNPNGKSFPDYYYNHESVYRPDNSRYQLVGLTLYNTGNYYPGEHFVDFTTLYKDLYAYVEKNYDKPMMITEFAGAVHGGDKVAWTDDMLQSMAKFPKIKVAIWFHGVDMDAYGNPARIYLIDEPKENLNIFKKHLGSGDGGVSANYNIYDSMYVFDNK